MLRAILVATIATTILGPVALEARGEMPGSLRALRSAYRCPVVDRLEQIYEAGEKNE